MSADNALFISKRGDGKYNLQETNASTGCMIWFDEFDTLEEAVRGADKYMKENVVEYGVSFSL